MHYETGDVLDDLVRRVTDVIAVAGAGVLLVGAGGLRFARAFDERVAKLEQLQVDTKKGPSLEAHGRGEPVLVENLAEDSRVAGIRSSGTEM